MIKRKRFGSFLVFISWFLSCFVVPVSLYADGAEENTTANTAPTENLPSAAVSPQVPDTSAPGNVTIDFKDADIQSVLRILSLKSGVNIVAGKDVSGSVTIRLVDVPWEKALDVVLKTYGYAYDRNDNIIRVTTIENLKKEELSTEVFTLNYSQASEVEKSLKDILSDRGKIRSDARSNMLVVTDMPTVLQNVRKVIERLDTITPQVLIEAKVIETTLGDADKLGIKWSMKVGASGGARPSTFPFPAFSPVSKSIRNFLPEGRGSFSTSAAITNATTATTTVQDFPTADFSHQSTFPVADKSEFTFGTMDFSQFQAMLQMLKQRDNAKVLSEPHVTTLNNQEAKILVGDVIAIPKFERNSSTGRMEVTGYDDRDVGIRLSVKPQINSANEIVVEIHPEITSLLGYDDLTADIKAPHFTTREAETRVRIKNGQTIAIGGLIRENSVESKTKVPILGDIPILEKFFSFKDKTVQKTDLLFFMTVTVVSDKTALVPAAHKL